MKNCVGVDIGENSVKLAVMNGTNIVRLICEPLPDNLVRDGKILSPETLADVLRGAMHKNRAAARDCALVLPQDTAFTRRVTIPYMVAAEKGDKIYVASEESAIRIIEPELDKVWWPKGGEPVIARLKGGAE